MHTAITPATLDDRRVFLKTITRPSFNSRSHIIFDALEGPIFRGTSQNARSYCCGQCGAVLIEGVESYQFIEATEPLLPAQELIDIPRGDYVVTSTLLVSGSSTMVVSFNGALVLTCFVCQERNEMAGPGLAKGRSCSRNEISALGQDRSAFRSEEK